MDLLQALGQRVRHLREERSLTQEQLAERAGLHWTYISGIERGKRHPRIGVLVQLAGAFGISLSVLVEGLDRSQPQKRRSQ